MSNFLPNPAPPGSVAPAHLENVRELHGVVRGWIAAAATAQRSDNIRANLPYVDLMFAFGFATLGDHATANKLTEDARRVLVVPVPEAWNDNATFETTVSATVSNNLFNLFRYRIEQALAGNPHIGPLSAELVAGLEELHNKARGGNTNTNNPFFRGEYVIGRLRKQSRILEPQERVDPYNCWAKNQDQLTQQLANLHTIREPAALAETIRKLYRDGVTGKPLQEVQFFVLYEGLPLAARVGEAFTVELLEHVPAALLADDIGIANDSLALPRKQGELLERALFVAGHFNREDIVKRLVDDFTTLVRSKSGAVRLKLLNMLTRQCLRNLKKLGLTSEIDRLLTNLHSEVLGGASSTELRTKHASKPEEWSAVLQALLNLACGWLHLGRRDLATPILAEARNELLNANSLRLQTTDYTDLARAYVTALGQTGGTALNSLIELFREMGPTRINNTWTTAAYYSRFHLNLVEDTVFAVCHLAFENPIPVIVSESP